MKHISTTWLVLLWALLHPIAVGADGVTREFGRPPDQPACSGYAEIAFVVHGSNGRYAKMSHRIWFDGPSRYRIESTASFDPGLLTCVVHDGVHTYSAEVDLNSKHQPRWYASPSSWIGDGYLDTYLQPHRTLEHARLVETTSLQGLPTQHWRGTGKDSSRVIDAWVSTDSRFPFVLKWEARSRRSFSRWEMTRLDISDPLPGGIFTPQLHPRPGFMALLAMPYWPKWLALVWHLAFLACMGGCVLSLQPKGHRAARIVSGTLCGLAALALLRLSPRSSAYSYLFSDTPFQLIVLTLMAAFAFWMRRRAGWPKDAALFRGTRWPFALFAVVAAIVGAFLAFSYQHVFAWNLDVRSFAIPFQPAVLVNAIILCVGLAFLEEFVFRGYLFAALTAKGWSPRCVNVTQALIFAASHIPGDVRMFGLSFSLPVSFLCTFAFGLLFGHLRRRYGNLGAPWIVHTCYNIAYIYVGVASGLGIMQAALSTLR